MKKFLLFSLVLIAYNANAQFDIDQSYVFQNGDNVFVSGATITTNEGSAGANQIWDFSNYPAGDNVSGDVIKAYENKDLYNDGDLIVDHGNKSTLYQFYENKLLILGESYSFSNSGYESSYAPALQLLTFPLKYNEPQISNFNSKLLESHEISGTRKGYSSYTIDGYGQIILPGGKKYSNVVRVKSVVFYEDSTIYTAPAKRTQKEIKYSFYVENVRLPLIEFDYIEWINDINVSSKSESVIFYGENKTTDLADNQFNADPAFYPNPVAAGSIIQLNTSIRTVEIYNTLGAIIQVYDEDDRNLAIDLNPGLYVIKTTNELNKSTSAKLLVK